MNAQQPAAIIALHGGADPATSCLPVAGVPTIVRTVRALFAAVPAGRTVVVAAEQFTGQVREVLATHGCSDVVVVGCGAEAPRAAAVVAGIEAVGPASAFVLHDVGHPLAPGDVAARVLARVHSGARVAVPVLPMTDSVKAIDDRGVVTATVDRTTLFTAQYPRGFASSTLGDLVAGGAGDELAAALATGVPVSTVDGHADAVRFSLPRDLSLLGAIIGSRR